MAEVPVGRRWPPLLSVTMDLSRVVVQWSGVNIVGSAVSVLHFEHAIGSSTPPDVAAIRTAFATLGSALPISTTISVPGSGETITATNGTLVGTWAAGSTPAPITGSSTDTSAAGVGAVVNWLTGDIVGTRRVRGRTFIVPLSTFAYDQQGTLTTAQLTALGNFATALRAVTPALAIWHRPTSPGATDGTGHLVNGHRIRDHVAYLSSRRD